MHMVESKHLIKNDRSENGAYLGINRSMRYQERGLVHNWKNNLMHVIEQNESIMCDNQINQSINHKITYVGPPPKPVYFAWINITDSIILELWKIHSSLLKSKGA